MTENIDKLLTEIDALVSMAADVRTRLTTDRDRVAAILARIDAALGTLPTAAAPTPPRRLQAAPSGPPTATLAQAAMRVLSDASEPLTAPAVQRLMRRALPGRIHPNAAQGALHRLHRDGAVVRTGERGSYRYTVHNRED